MCLAKDEKRICYQSGKRCYETQSEAEQIIKYFRNNHYTWVRRKKTIPTRAYRCQFCGEWHLTHYKGKNRPKEKR